MFCGLKWFDMWSKMRMINSIKSPKINVNDNNSLSQKPQCSSVFTEIWQNQIDHWRKISLQLAICRYPLVVTGGVGFKCGAKRTQYIDLTKGTRTEPLNPVHFSLGHCTSKNQNPNYINTTTCFELYLSKERSYPSDLLKQQRLNTGLSKCTCWLVHES